MCFEENQVNDVTVNQVDSTTVWVGWYDSNDRVIFETALEDLVLHFYEEKNKVIDIFVAD